MSDLRGPFLPLSAARVAAPAITAAATALAFVAGVGAGASSHVTPPDRCALPSGIDLAALPAHDQAFVVRHALACRDLEAGRISAERFRALWDAPAPPPPPPPAPPLAVDASPIWASSVRSASTQYSNTSWSAARALGAPDVYPAGGDQVNAWASRGADDRIEHLELAFDTPRRIMAVDVFETYNPGAVSRIELIATDGTRTIAYEGEALAIAQPSYQRHISFHCTDQRIAAVRITIDSPAVEGWNEIDAVGITPCE
jgi:hypothetical protein